MCLLICRLDLSSFCSSIFPSTKTSCLLIKRKDVLYFSDAEYYDYIYRKIYGEYGMHLYLATRRLAVFYLG